MPPESKYYMKHDCALLRKDMRLGLFNNACDWPSLGLGSPMDVWRAAHLLSQLLSFSGDVSRTVSHYHELSVSVPTQVLARSNRLIHRQLALGPRALSTWKLSIVFGVCPLLIYRLSEDTPCWGPASFSLHCLPMFPRPSF